MVNSITKLFSIKYPIVQAGMIWCSGWKLVSAVSNAGGLGIIGAGSMYPDILKMHIRKCKEATNQPFGVNVPLLYPNIEEIMKVLIEEKVEIVFTSAGNPKTWTSILKENNITVVHVVANQRFAQKAIDAGVDAIVAEGFEAGGHNGKEETTTMCLIPHLVKNTAIPIIAAGGIGTGATMLAAMALGADGVQIGSRFVLSNESSAHEDFKKEILQTKEGDTTLMMKDIVPVRLMHNKFYQKVSENELLGKSREERIEHLGRGRAKKGMFLGDMEEGELEIGQISSYLEKIIPAADIVDEIVTDYNKLLVKLAQNKL